jgi:nucleoside-diphosphate-sugar epimerase
VTGATGVVGTEVVRLLAGQPDVDLVAVSRRGDAGSGVHAWRIGTIPPAEWPRGRFDVVVHAAANTRWNQRPGDAWSANVATTEAVLDLIDRDTHLVHVSTAFAVGLRDDVASPDLADYRNTYEWSKAAAERLVEGHERRTIVRLPLVIGRRHDGLVARFNGLYTLVRALVSGRAPAFVAEPDAKLEMVPTDDAAAAIVVAVDGEPADNPVVLGCGDAALEASEVLEATYRSLNRWRTAHGVPELDPPPLLSTARWERFFLPFARETMSNRQYRAVELLSEFMPYVSLDAPVNVTHVVAPVGEAIARSITYWADTNPRAARAVPQPWVAGDSGPDRPDGLDRIPA